MVIILISPLFMWAGGKSKMLKHYAGLLPDDNETYIEPFMGGGAMFLHVRQTMPSYTRFVINDLNDEIMGIYRHIRDDPGSFIAAMDRYQASYMPLDKADRRTFYYDLRGQYMSASQNWSPIQEAASLYFLMKTGFNGIWQTCKASQGRFGTPCGLLNQKAAVYDAATVRGWSDLLQGVTIETGDWRKCCSRHDSAKTWFFLDPPYRGGFTTYGKAFDDQDQLDILAFMGSCAGEASLCNRDLDDGFFQTHLPAGYDIKLIDVVYTAGRRKRTTDGFEAKPAREVFIYKN